MHPARPGRPVLAIECDGAAYHSSATARDRDRLRQAHLRGELRQIAEWIASDGLLRTDEEMVREILAALSFERLGSRIRDRLDAVARVVARRSQRR